jgi:phosphate transport system protein
MLTEHTSKQFDTELETVRLRVLQMGGLVEEQIANAIEALVNRRLELADEVIANDLQVNAMEVEIDESCSHIIVRRQPTAVDLRLIMTVIKTITDLERIGNEAEKIAQMAKLIYQADRLSTPRFKEIKQMSSIVLHMLRQSLDGFARLDLNVAVQVPRQDIEVDEAYRLCMRHLITYMMEDPRTISTSIEVLFAAKAIERIGDHAKNMSEYVVYMVKGKDVRHTSFEAIEREVASAPL